MIHLLWLNNQIEFLIKKISEKNIRWKIPQNKSESIKELCMIRGLQSEYIFALLLLMIKLCALHTKGLVVKTASIFSWHHNKIRY